MQFLVFSVSSCSNRAIFSSYFLENFEEFGVFMGLSLHVVVWQELQTGSNLFWYYNTNCLFQIWGVRDSRTLFTFHLILTSSSGGSNYSSVLQMRKIPRPRRPALSKARVVGLDPNLTVCLPVPLPLAIALAPLYTGRTLDQATKSSSLQIPQPCNSGLDLIISEVPSDELLFILKLGLFSRMKNDGIQSDSPDRGGTIQTLVTKRSL